MALRFVGKTAIVTGAGGGLGRSYALELAKRGCNVVVNDIGGSLTGDTKSRRDAAGDVVKEILKLGAGKAVSNSNSVLEGASIVEQALKEFGSCDIIINNAGTLRDKSFHKMSKDDWRSVVDTHLNGTFEMCHAAWPLMQQQKFGRIINVGSGAGVYGNFGQANYSAAKMGILGLTNTLAKEGEKFNINVNCVVPIAASRMTETVLPPNILQMLDPGHITPLVTFLAHESCQETGGVFEVGGGWYSKLRWERSAGVALGSEKSFASAEDVHKAWTMIGDFATNSSHPTAPGDALGSILAASSAGTQTTTTSSSGSAASSVHVSSSDQSNSAEVQLPAMKSDKIFGILKQHLESNKAQAADIANQVKASVQFELKDASGHTKKWVLDMSTAEAKIYVAGPNEPRANALISCADETFVKLATGKTSAEFAYMRGQLKVKGNVAVVMRVKSLLAMTAEMLPKDV